jgi:hypothetical protein
MKLHTVKDLRKHKPGQVVYYTDSAGNPVGIGRIADVFYSSMSISWAERRGALLDYDDDAWDRIALCCSKV